MQLYIIYCIYKSQLKPQSSGGHMHLVDFRQSSLCLQSLYKTNVDCTHSYCSFWIESNLHILWVGRMNAVLTLWLSEINGSSGCWWWLMGGRMAQVGWFGLCHLPYGPDDSITKHWHYCSVVVKIFSFVIIIL